MNSNNNNNKFYIFLDIDGVLALTAQHYSNPKKWHPRHNVYWYDKKSVKVFNSIVDNVPNIVIILSSDWKTHYTLDEMNDIFKLNGINLSISDFTRTSWGKMFTSSTQLEECRAYEILQYVKDHDIENYVAIDDLDLSQWISEEHFVHTPRENEGIKQSGVKEKILTIINK